MADKTKVLILMGSASDRPVMEEASKALSEFDVSFEMHIASAHRTPDKVRRLVGEAESKDTRVIIAGAGYAAHLAGAAAAHTTLPVIGVPLDASSLGGIDALMSTAQMPSGMPVATMSIGKAGAKNAAILAAQILATSDEKLRARLKASREKMAEGVEQKDEELNR